MKRKIFGILFALVLVLSFSLVTAVPAAAATIDVDDSMDTSAINAEIAGAEDGDIIVFAAGTYVLTEPLVVAVPGVTLQGANVEVPGTGDRGDESTIDATSSVGGAHEGGAVAITADGVKVDGFTITGARHHAIWVSGSQGCTITNNILADNDWRGVLLRGGSNGNTITNNAISDSGRDGIYLFEENVGGNTITSNVISHSGRAGIYVSWSDDNTIENNVISYSGEVDSGEWVGGISLNGAFRNTLTGNTLSNQRRGITMRDSEDNTLTKNTISSNEYGIYLRAPAVTGNVGNEVHYNDIVDNTEYGVYNCETEIFDATSNWWGSANGPGEDEANDVSANVAYSPWLGQSKDAEHPWIFCVDDVGDEPAAGYIQTAIDAALAGDTVNVAEGTYAENLSIPPGKDNLRLLGAGMENTILSPASGTAITVGSPVTIKGFHILQSDGAIAISIAWASSGVSGTGENRGVIDANKLESPSASRGNGIDFKDYVSDYWVIKDNKLINRKLAIYLNRASHLGIIGNTLTGYKEGIGMNWDGEPAHDLTIVGNRFLGTDYPFTPEELLGKAAIMLGEVSYNVTIAGNTITDSPSGIRIPDTADPTNLSDVYIHANDIYNNANYGIINDVSVEVDASYNWWGNPNGPGAIAFGSYPVGDAVSGEVDYSPWLPGEWEDFVDLEAKQLKDTDEDGFSDLDEYWLGTDPNVDTSYPGAGIGEVDTDYVAGDDPGKVTLQDSAGPIADVDISGAPVDASGTITGARYTDELEPIESSLSLGTGTSGVVFLDVRVTGYTDGIARITVPYLDEEPEGGDGIVDGTDPPVLEHTLGLYYWDEAWCLATNNEVDHRNNNVSGDIPISALTGTPIAMGGYLPDEATVAIESILNLSYSGDDTVELTIDTNTAFLGAATIDLMFDPRVVEVLGVVEDGVNGKNSAFDTLTVNPEYGFIGIDTQIARFVAHQGGGAAGVDATEGAVVAVVKLKAAGSTMDVSPLELHLETLTDNKGDWIPYTFIWGAQAIVGGIGDANRDGVVDPMDVIEIECAIAGFTEPRVYSIDGPTMDVSGDGMVDSWDCTYLARHLAELPTEFPEYPLGG